MYNIIEKVCIGQHFAVPMEEGEERKVQSDKS